MAVSSGTGSEQREIANETFTGAVVIEPLGGQPAVVYLGGDGLDAGQGLWTIGSSVGLDTTKGVGRRSQQPYIQLGGGDWPALYVPVGLAGIHGGQVRAGSAPIDLPEVGSAPPGSAAAGEGWRELVARYFPPEAVETVMGIGQCESGWRANAISADGRNWGPLQINLVHVWRVGGDPYRLLDPETNIRVASEVWRDNNGFSPWACY